MPRAPKATKPERHECCPHAGQYLKARSSGGEWGWCLTFGSDLVSVPVIHCPWCGLALPRVREPRQPMLSVVQHGKGQSS